MEDAEANGEAAQIPDLDRINRAGRHLLALVNDVLDVGRIGSANIELVVRPFDLARFIDDVGADCRSLVTVNGNNFVVEKGGDLGVISTDETRMRQVLINLLSNAGKFTSKGVVTLGVRRAAHGVVDTVLISVKDTGIGISSANIERLFTHFNQADASTAAKYGGTGLGLALSRTLCRLMHGDISVESEVGQGSTFTVRLPVECRCSADAPRASNAVAA